MTNIESIADPAALVELNTKVVEEETTETSETPKPGPRPKAPPKKGTAKEPLDPDRFIDMAKKVVVDNYNSHRDTSRSPELPDDGVYIVWFCKVLGNWKAIVASPIIRGLLWEVTSNGHRAEVYLDVYKKLNNVKIALGEDS